MDRGTERETPPGRGAGDDVVLEHTAAGRVPLAVILVDRAGLVSHWSRGARRLFGVTKEEAIGQTAVDLLPVSGALPDDEDTGSQGVFAHYDGLGPDLSPPSTDACPTPPRAAPASPCPSEARGGPLPEGWGGTAWTSCGGPTPGRPRTGAAPRARRRRGRPAPGPPGTDGAFERIAPGFALHTDFPAPTNSPAGFPRSCPA